MKFDLKKLFLWFLIILLISVATGLISAFFLESLSYVTDQRVNNNLWIYLLPVGGLIIGLSYYFLSKGVEGGNNLLIQEMDRPRRYIHWKIIPLVLFGTIATHLFGGSAGREGTAVQMGGAIGDQIQHFFKWTKTKRHLLMRMGVAGGFAGVFGTPLAGVIFAIEFARDRKFDLKTLVLSTLVAFGSDFVCHFVGVGHTTYIVRAIPSFSIENILWILLIGIIFGGVAWIFSSSKQVFQKLFNLIPLPYLRPFFGGIILLGLFLLFDISKFLGLGIPSIVEAFNYPVHPGDVWIKLLLTALTLGAGFKGGEATPLFFMGAVMGSTLAFFVPLPVSFMAGAGFVAVFGAATNTPLASSLMAAELFGFEGLPLYIVICLMAYYLSGKTSVYATQQPLLRKWSIRDLKRK
tara:strand:+ start:50211 stop:51431 length:1221 start_codon:yes stop_codon:yes gene_type:complete